jgi:hypothetical protein
MSREAMEKPDVRGKPLSNELLASPETYWADQVEQYEAAGLDFVAPWLKGASPVDGKITNTPARLATLVRAIEAHGLTGKLTILPYDDNPASWTAAWNFSEGRGYNYARPFPVDDPAVWSFVWERNFQAFFDAVPERHLFKIEGRPVFAIWSCSGAFLSGISGHGSRLITYIKDQCERRYGWRPHFRAPADWIAADPSSAAPGIVDSTAAWFEPKPRTRTYSRSVSRHGGVVHAVLIPSFDVNGEYWDPEHGRTLEENLRYCRVDQAADVTLVEGFDNYFEDCTLWRVRHRQPDGTALPFQVTGYDYPNQRINILRRYSNAPSPAVLRLEAEWCDDFGGYPDCPNRYRNGPIRISESPDPADPPHGYVVDDTRSGQWLEWREVPMAGRVNLRLRYAAGPPCARLRIVIGAAAPVVVDLPTTGGPEAFSGHLVAGIAVPSGDRHTVRIEFMTSGVVLNRWTVERDPHQPVDEVFPPTNQDKETAP